ncbi:hypothetical protein AMTR_s00040p00235550 [Amborella trichopoda]|uniref:Uncharacterized protein n=1 Tax=Amborella trichopoda TaxID=13333 RepID=W1PZ18_AMBTC|nr:hypothetical protein AMTR_s00040p00235550 [Amborella trichopoda]
MARCCDLPRGGIRGFVHTSGGSPVCLDGPVSFGGLVLVVFPPDLNSSSITWEIGSSSSIETIWDSSACPFPLASSAIMDFGMKSFRFGSGGNGWQWLFLIGVKRL